MRVQELQRKAVVLKGWSESPVALGLSLALLLIPGPSPAQAVAATVSPVEQSARDDERLRILRDELRKSEALVETLAKRKAERLAAADRAGADDAEAQRVRTLDDIAGLQREIAATRPSTAGTRSTAAPAAAPARSSQPKAQPAPWWDVYAKVRRGDTPAPVSYAQPSGPAAARATPTHRME